MGDEVPRCLGMAVAFLDHAGRRAPTPHETKGHLLALLGLGAHPFPFRKGFGLWVLGFGLWVLGFGFWVLGSGVWVQGLGSPSLVGRAQIGDCLGWQATKASATGA